MSQPNWTRREVDAPAENLLSPDEVARLLGISEDTLQDLIKDGEFPEPMMIGDEVQVYDWQDVVYYLLRIRVSARLVGYRKPPHQTSSK